jgi:integrase
MPNRITNRWYRQFLDDRTIEPITEEEVKKALENIKGDYADMGRALLITLYYTGCRPAEALELKTENFSVQGTKLSISFKTLKRGVPRQLILSMSQNKLLMQLSAYAKTMPPQLYIFHRFRGAYVRSTRLKDGTTKTRTETSYKVYWHLIRWFKNVREGSIPPYFLRHSLFSKLGEKGLTTRELAYVKGARRESSVEAYVHITPKQKEKISKAMSGR